MAYQFINTITSLPWHYLRFTWENTAGSGSFSATNGGYIESLSEISESIDVATGDITLANVTFGLINIGNVFSANIFTPGASDIVLLKIEISFDLGSTWETIFIGRAEPELRTYADGDATIAQNRTYSIPVSSVFTSLKSAPLQYIPGSPAYFAEETDSFSGGLYAIWNTSDKGVPYFTGRTIASKFIALTNAFRYISESLIFGSFAPTIAVDYSLLENSAKNNTTGLGYDISKWYLFSSDGSWWINAEDNGSKSAGNCYELFRQLCQSLGCVPRQVYGAGTYTIHLVPRFISSAAAITGPLGVTTARSWKNAPWAVGGTVTTPRLPKVFKVGDTGGKSLNLKNLFATAPIGPGSLDKMVWHNINREGYDGKFSNDDKATANLVYVKCGANDFRLANSARISSAQSYTESVPGWYGFQESLYDYCISPTTGNYLRGSQEGYELTVNGIIGSSYSDIQILKKVTIGSTDCIITGISRNLFTNEMKITAAAL